MSHSQLFTFLFLQLLALSKADQFNTHDPSTNSGNLDGAEFCEDLGIGDIIYTITADVEIVEGTLVVKGDFSDYVEVRPNGDLVLIKQFDFDKGKDYLKVDNISANANGIIYDGAGAGYFVFILNANDNPPVVPSLDLIPNIYEYPWTDEVIGTFQINDADGSEMDVFQFETSDKFEIELKERNTYNVKVKPGVQFDFDRAPVDISEIVVKDNQALDCGVAPDYSFSSTMVIQLKDGPDSPPVFTQLPGVLDANEDQLPGEEIGAVEAIDQDYGLNWEMNYEIIDDVGIVSEYFEVGASTGIITIKKQLDRENLPDSSGRLQMTIKATEVVPTDDPFADYKDFIGYPFSITATLTISIEDTDDSLPVFYQLANPGDIDSKMEMSSFSTSLDESSYVGSTVQDLNIYVEDADQGNNARFKLKIEEDVPFRLSTEEVFGSSIVNIIIDSSSDLLDYEVQGSVPIMITILATDFTTGATLSKALVNITLIDANDNSPVFEDDSPSFTVYENSPPGTLVGTVVATDADSNENGEITYGIDTDNDYFEIEPDTGEIIVKFSDLDHEKVNIQYLTLTATDGGGGTASVLAEITIEDVNDNYPVFDDTSPFEVDEHSANTRVGQVRATDLDSDLNSEIIYSVDPAFADNFEINPDTGELKTISDKLDRETMANPVEITLIATDKGVPPLSASKIFEIILRDINDNAPVITNLPETIGVNEGKYKPEDGPEIFTVTAEDDDEPGNRNSKLSFSIVENDLPFDVDPDTGNVKIVADIDYEKDQSFEVTILVQDNGASVRREDEKILTINVIDINDNSPEFNYDQKEQHFSVEEGPPGETSVVLMEATDKDSSTMQDNHYYVIGGTGKEFFDVEETGIPTLKRIKDVDRDVGQTNFSLVVKVTEGADLPSETNANCTDDKTIEEPSLACILLEITDINDCVPQFQADVFNTDIPLEQAPNPDIAMAFVVAVDNDEGENAVMHYEITNQESECDGVKKPLDSTFTIGESNGNIFLVKDPQIEVGCNFFIDVKVKDNDDSHSDKAQMIIGVIDEDQKAELLSTFTQEEFDYEMKLQFEKDLGAILGATVIVDTVLSYESPTNPNIHSQINCHAKVAGTNELVPSEDIYLALDANSQNVNVFNAEYGIAGRTLETVENINENMTEIVFICLIAALALLCITLSISVVCMKQRINRNKRVERAMEQANNYDTTLSANKTGMPINYKSNENPLFDELGNQPTLDIENPYESTDDLDDEIDDNAIDSDYNGSEESQDNTQVPSSRESTTDEFAIDFSGGDNVDNSMSPFSNPISAGDNANNPMSLAAALSEAVEGTDNFGFEDTGF